MQNNLTKERAAQSVDLWSTVAAQNPNDPDWVNQKRRELAVHLRYDVDPTDFANLVDHKAELNQYLGMAWDDQWDTPAERLRCIQSTEELVRKDIADVVATYGWAA